jgi:signal transduction histidine kinase
MRLLDVRLLDPVHSIKAKLGWLVLASVGVTAVLIWYGLLIAGWRSRYTLPVVVLIALAVTQVLAHGMTSPLRQMTAAAKAMAAGLPVPPVRATSRDEVGELARAFTAMSADLADVDAQRRELLANLAHELRTPVAALQAQLENLVDGVRSPDPAALLEALQQTERLGGLVEDLLGLARAEAGATPLRRSEVDLARLTDQVVREISAVHPRCRITAEVAPALVADADPARLRQVLVNLVDNAARHAPAGGDVRLTAHPDGAGGVVVEVLDDGPGIPSHEQDVVFERFRRGLPVTPAQGMPVSRQDGGTGLGLAIARWAVGLHGGRIAVVPSLEGCRIRVELPARPGDG